MVCSQVYINSRAKAMGPTPRPRGATMNIKKIIARYASANDIERAFLRELAKDEAKRASRWKVDPLGESLLRKDRTRRKSPSGESWVEYGYVYPADVVYDYDPEVGEWETYLSLTDAELDEWFRDNMETHPSYEWDCTGQPCTVSIDWHRNPCGLISFQHHLALDI